MFRKLLRIGILLSILLPGPAMPQPVRDRLTNEDLRMLLKSMSLRKAGIGDESAHAIMAALDSGRVGEPQFWTSPKRAQPYGAAIVDGPANIGEGCRIISYYAYDAAKTLVEIKQSVACEAPGADWSMSRIEKTLSLPVVAARQAGRCPAGKRDCSVAEQIIGHARSTPTWARQAFAQARNVGPTPTPRPVSAPQAAVAPRPAAGRTPDIKALLNDILVQDSRSWRANRYNQGSVTDTHMDGAGTTFVATGNYRFDGLAGPGRGWVKASFKAGKLDCLEFWDQPGTCRRLGYSLSAQIAAAQASKATSAPTGPRRKGCNVAAILQYCPLDSLDPGSGLRTCSGKCWSHRSGIFKSEDICNSETGAFYSTMSEAKADACR